MDYVKKLSSALVILGMAAALTGCPEDKATQFIWAFTAKQIPVGGSDTAVVSLYEAPLDNLYVVLSGNSNPMVVQATYNALVDTKITIKFRKGETKKIVQLKALKPGDANLTFKIRDTNKYSTLSVKVVPVSYPDGQWDSGQMPDYAGMEAGADKSTTTPDKSTGDKSTGDKSTGEASTPTPDTGAGDTGTTTPDTGSGG